MTELPDELQSATKFYEFLGVKCGERAFLEKHSVHRYSAALIPKRSGGTRMLLVPEPRLKFLQRRTLHLLEKLYSVRSPVHGFVTGRGAVSNANEHQRRPYLLNIDLKDYFGAISRRRLIGMLEAVGLDTETAKAVAVVCVTRNQLPQGAPTSPLLANMISYRLDGVLMRFAKQHHLRYTRYADDISLSSYTQPLALFEGGLPASGKVQIEKLSEPLRAAIHSNGFEINPGKVWFAGPRARKEVTGLVVNEFTNVKRTFVRDVRAALYKLEKVGVTAAEKDYQSRYKTSAALEWIVRGRLEWIGQVRGRRFSAYRTLAKRFNRLFPHSPPLPIEPTNEDIVDRAVWIVEFAEGTTCRQGTAFFLEGVGLVTANHVLKDLPVGKSAELFKPKTSTRYSVTASGQQCEHRDLVVLTHHVPADAYHNLPASASPNNIHDDIVALGFPDYGPGDELSKRHGKIVARPTKHGVKLIEVSATLPDGISGGPIVNNRYEVVGVAQRGGYDQNRQLAVEISELLRLVSEKPKT
ncbi:reverse transcriptase domain-containing protein [Reyranella sp.]|uniref:reverse transcriptase domain-containing protein n=1 Tax=Reyranella sp. TaxID=1929291 RepID=UPI003BA93542